MSSFDPEDREAFIESVDGVLAREFTSDVRRELWSQETGRSPRLWAALSDIGVNGLLIAEEYGGVGASEVELGCTLESLARFGVHDTVLEGQVAGSFLQRAGDASLRERWLPGIAAGTTRVALKLASSRFVRDAGVADAVVYQTNESVYLLEPGDFVAARVQSQDPAERLFVVSPTKPLTRGTLWNEPDSGRALAQIQLGLGALSVGVSSYLLSLTVQYVKDRRQFGRPIGQFQALKHLLADAHAWAWVAGEAVRAATEDLVKTDTANVFASRAARLSAANAGRVVSDAALQCHGGIGFTWEHDLHGYLKAAKVYEYAYGGGRRLAREVGTAALSGVTA